MPPEALASQACVRSAAAWHHLGRCRILVERQSSRVAHICGRAPPSRAGRHLADRGRFRAQNGLGRPL
eukprot:1119536-Pyramimonas_sp.AAC.1